MMLAAGRRHLPCGLLNVLPQRGARSRLHCAHSGRAVEPRVAEGNTSAIGISGVSDV